MCLQVEVSGHTLPWSTGRVDRQVGVVMKDIHYLGVQGELAARLEWSGHTLGFRFLKRNLK